MDDLFFIYSIAIIVAALAGLMTGLVIGFILGRNDERKKENNSSFDIRLIFAQFVLGLFLGIRRKVTR